MNNEDINKLIEHNARVSLLLGEIMGRLVMIFNTEHEDMSEAIGSLLDRMKYRIDRIYYGDNK